MSQLPSRTVKVRFKEKPVRLGSGNSTKVTFYSYFIPIGDEPVPGDVVLTSVRTSVADREADRNDEAMETYGLSLDSAVQLQAAVVVEVEEVPSPKATKFYAKLVPMAEVRTIYEQNKGLAEAVRLKAEAKAKLQTLLAEQNDMERFETLAATNPEAARLLEILKR